MRTTETEVQVSEAKITEVEMRIGKNVLYLIEASKLSTEDEFMQYRPKRGTEEAKFKQLLTDTIKSGTLRDFWRPRMDPSFDGTDYYGICYVAGKRPAVGKSFYWWKKAAKKLGLQMGTRKQYIAFLGWLIKRLVETGWNLEKAWNAVCSNSEELGHYYFSKDAKDNFEGTGNREVCDFYDLGNTFKILAEDEEAGGLWIAGGFYNDSGCNYPLTHLEHEVNPYNSYYATVGWLVLN